MLDPALLDKAAPKMAEVYYPGSPWRLMPEASKALIRESITAALSVVADDLRAEGWHAAADHLEDRYEHEAAYEVRLANPHRGDTDDR